MTAAPAGLVLAGPRLTAQDAPGSTISTTPGFLNPSPTKAPVVAGEERQRARGRSPLSKVCAPVAYHRAMRRNQDFHHRRDASTVACPFFQFFLIGGIVRNYLCRACRRRDCLRRRQIVPQPCITSTYTPSQFGNIGWCVVFRCSCRTEPCPKIKTQIAWKIPLCRLSPGSLKESAAHTALSAHLLHGFDQLHLQNLRTGDPHGEWSGDQASTMLRSLAYASD